MVVYKVTNLINGKVYVGQTNGNNKYYLGSGSIILKAIKKYGRENFKKEILEECDTQQQLDDREIFWISFYKSNEIGYNIMEGGNGGAHSEETKIKMSINHTGVKNNFYKKTHTNETKKILSEKMKDRLKNKENHPNYGKKFSEESKKKMSDKRKNKQTGKDNPMYGKSVYDVWLFKFGKEEADKKYEMFVEKMRNIGKKRTQSEETKTKIRNSNLGRKLSDESKMKISKCKIGKGKKVIQLNLNYNFIKEWNSLVEIKKEVGINVGRVCRGERKKCGEYIWVYKEKYTPQN